MSAAKYIKALKSASQCGDVRYFNLTPYEKRAITKYLFAVLKQTPFKSYFKALVCVEELGGFLDPDNELLDKVYNVYMDDTTYSLFNTDGFSDYLEVAKKN